MEIIWRAIAWLCSRPAISEWIIRTAQQRPYWDIGDYMARWWFMPNWALRKTPQGWYDIRKWMPVRIRLHHIARPDADPVLHSHPLNFRSIILDGHYVNENVFGRKSLRRRGDTWSGTRETLHRIDSVSHQGAWTLFIFFGNEKYDWGFMAGDPPRLISYEQYTSPNGRDKAREGTAVDVSEGIK